MNVSTTTRAAVVRPALAGLTLAAAVLLLTTTSAGSANAAAGDPGFLGTADSYAVLAYSEVTNSGALTHVVGNVGVAPGTAVTGFGSTQITGTTDTGPTSAAGQAMTDATAAYVTLAGLSATGTFPSGDMTGFTPVPGVYTNASLLTGTLTLNGSANDVWVFQSPSDLTTGPGSSVVLLGAANPCNVYWQVGSSASLDTGTAFVGTIIAQASITLNTAASIQGRLLAQTGAVTLLDNTVTRPLCANPASAGAGAAGAGTAVTGGTTGTTTTGDTAPLDTTADTAAKLPATGSDSTPFFLGGAALAIVGTALLLVSRRRSATGA